MTRVLQLGGRRRYWQIPDTRVERFAVPDLRSGRRVVPLRGCDPWERRFLQERDPRRERRPGSACELGGQPLRVALGADLAVEGECVVEAWAGALAAQLMSGRQLRQKRPNREYLDIAESGTMVSGAD